MNRRLLQGQIIRMNLIFIIYGISSQISSDHFSRKNVMLFK